MQTVLIATTNEDKFNIVKGIFQATIFPKEEYIIIRPQDLDVKLSEVEEKGTISERARAKALHAREELLGYDIDIFVGVDDAIIMKGRVEPDIKKYMKKILYEGYFVEGEQFCFSRAYCLVDREKNMKETIADVPYLYKEDKTVEFRTQAYPLDEVAFPLGSDISIAAMNTEEKNEYYFQYIKEPIKSLSFKGVR